MRSWILLGMAVVAVAALPGAGGGAAGAAAGSAPQALKAGKLRGTIPGEWTAQPPAGQFRLAQYVLPKAAGDTAPATLMVFHFGPGGGGSLEANLRRWQGMVRRPADAPAPKPAKFEPAGLRITALDLSGTYLERPFPASDQVIERPDHRMLAAVVETTQAGGDGPYYFRLVGPAKTVAAAQPAWENLLKTLRVE